MLDWTNDPGLVRVTSDRELVDLYIWMSGLEMSTGVVAAEIASRGIDI